MLETDPYYVHDDYYDHIAPDTNSISHKTTDENISNITDIISYKADENISDITDTISEVYTQSAEVL